MLKRSITLGLSTALSLTLGAPIFLEAQGANPVTGVVTDAWNGAKRNIRDSAIQMPEDGYAFKPVDTVRTFGQMLAHVTGANYVYCSAARGEKSPYGEDHFEKTLKSKADIVKALEQSLAYCDQAYAAATDARLAEMIDQPFGGGKGARAAALVGNTGHLQEHYGNLVTYFRIKGMVPPSSQPRK